MHKDTYFLFTFILIATIATLHTLAYIFFWYWTLWWFDILMHFLGGLWVAVTSLWFFYLSGYVRKPKVDFKTCLLITLGSILVIGALWEVFELSVGAYRETNHVLDTAIDLIMDVIGSILGLFLFIKARPISSVEESIHVDK